MTAKKLTILYSYSSLTDRPKDKIFIEDTYAP